MAKDVFARGEDIESVGLTSSVASFQTEQGEELVQVRSTVPEGGAKNTSIVNKILITILLLCFILAIAQFAFSFGFGDHAKTLSLSEIEAGANRRRNPSRFPQTNDNPDNGDTAAHQPPPSTSTPPVDPIYQKPKPADEAPTNKKAAKDDKKNKLNQPKKKAEEVPTKVSKKEEEDASSSSSSDKPIKDSSKDTSNKDANEKHETSTNTTLSPTTTTTSTPTALNQDPSTSDAWWETVDESRIAWGHYKPHLIYSISEKKRNPMSMSMSYLPIAQSRQLMVNFKDGLNHHNIMFNFVRNDGVRFSQFLITDTQFDLKINSWLVKQRSAQTPSKNDLTWQNLHKIEKSSYNSSGQRSLIFTFSREVYDIKQAADEGRRHFHLSARTITEEGVLTIDAFSFAEGSPVTAEMKREGQFKINVFKEGKRISIEAMKEQVKIQQIAESTKNSNNWDVKSKIVTSFSANTGNLFSQQQVPEDQIIDFMLLQVSFDENEHAVLIEFNEDETAKSSSTLEDVDKEIARLTAAFDVKFKNFAHAQESNDVAANEEMFLSCSTSALSNLFGGLTYKFGELTYTQQEQKAISQPKAIFSFTPSRTRFGWSFLWDDGFHNAVASKFQPELSAIVIKSWLDTADQNGWICREQSRGEEATGLCNCPGFIQKDNKDGNPPTLILAIDYFRREKPQVLRQMIEEGYLEKISRWYFWYLRNLMVKDKQFTGDASGGNSNDFSDYEKNSYVFKYWDKHDQVASMNSGLDDYPRSELSDHLSRPIGHIDLQSWMVLFTKLMSDLHEFAGDTTTKDRFDQLLFLIKERTDEYFLDETDLIYKDIISDTNQLNDAKHTSHFGYPNLLPIAFGIVPNGSKSLTSYLKRITNPNLLWTPYGLRSLSQADNYFGRGNNYWTNPIWIQMNYLVLRGLKLHYAAINEDAKKVYFDLRDNVRNLVCKNWKRTGYFFENYNKNNDGMGSDAFPFTGWTATIALINAEEY